MAWNQIAKHALAAFLTLTLFSACRTTSTSDVKEAPSGDSALHWWGLQSIRFDDLPMEKTLPKVPWPGDYWATYQGGISYRWQDPSDSEDFHDYLYEIPKKQDVDAMSDDEVNKTVSFREI